MDHAPERTALGRPSAPRPRASSSAGRAAAPSQAAIERMSYRDVLAAIAVRDPTLYRELMAADTSVARGSGDGAAVCARAAPSSSSAHGGHRAGPAHARGDQPAGVGKAAVAPAASGVVQSLLPIVGGTPAGPSCVRSSAAEVVSSRGRSRSGNHSRAHLQLPHHPTGATEADSGMYGGVGSPLQLAAFSPFEPMLPRMPNGPGYLPQTFVAGLSSAYRAPLQYRGGGCSGGGGGGGGWASVQQPSLESVGDVIAGGGAPAPLAPLASSASSTTNASLPPASAVRGRRLSLGSSIFNGPLIGRGGGGGGGGGSGGSGASAAIDTAQIAHRALTAADKAFRDIVEAKGLPTGGTSGAMRCSGDPASDAMLTTQQRASAAMLTTQQRASAASFASSGGGALQAVRAMASSRAALPLMPASTQTANSSDAEAVRRRSSARGFSASLHIASPYMAPVFARPSAVELESARGGSAVPPASNSWRPASLPSGRTAECLARVSPPRLAVASSTAVLFSSSFGESATSDDVTAPAAGAAWRRVTTTAQPTASTFLPRVDDEARESSSPRLCVRPPPPQVQPTVPPATAASASFLCLPVDRKQPLPRSSFDLRSFRLAQLLQAPPAAAVAPLSSLAEGGVPGFAPSDVGAYWPDESHVAAVAYERAKAALLARITCGQQLVAVGSRSGASEDGRAVADGGGVGPPPLCSDTSTGSPRSAGRPVATPVHLTLTPLSATVAAQRRCREGLDLCLATGDDGAVRAALASTAGGAALLDDNHGGRAGVACWMSPAVTAVEERAVTHTQRPAPSLPPAGDTVAEHTAPPHRQCTDASSLVAASATAPPEGGERQAPLPAEGLGSQAVALMCSAHTLAHTAPHELTAGGDSNSGDAAAGLGCDAAAIFSGSRSSCVGDDAWDEDNTERAASEQQLRLAHPPRPLGRDAVTTLLAMLPPADGTDLLPAVWERLTAYAHSVAPDLLDCLPGALLAGQSPLLLFASCERRLPGSTRAYVADLEAVLEQRHAARAMLERAAVALAAPCVVAAAAAATTDGGPAAAPAAAAASADRRPYLVDPVALASCMLGGDPALARLPRDDADLLQAHFDRLSQFAAVHAPSMLATLGPAFLKHAQHPQVLWAAVAQRFPNAGVAAFCSDLLDAGDERSVARERVGRVLDALALQSDGGGEARSCSAAQVPTDAATQDAAACVALAAAAVPMQQQQQQRQPVAGSPACGIMDDAEVHDAALERPRSALHLVGPLSLEALAVHAARAPPTLQWAARPPEAPLHLFSSCDLGGPHSSSATSDGPRSTGTRPPCTAQSAPDAAAAVAVPTHAASAAALCEVGGSHLGAHCVGCSCGSAVAAEETRATSSTPTVAAAQSSWRLSIVERLASSAAALLTADDTQHAAALGALLAQRRREMAPSSAGDREGCGPLPLVVTLTLMSGYRDDAPAFRDMLSSSVPAVPPLREMVDVLQSLTPGQLVLLQAAALSPPTESHPVLVVAVGVLCVLLGKPATVAAGQALLESDPSWLRAQLIALSQGVLEEGIAFHEQQQQHPASASTVPSTPGRSPRPNSECPAIAAAGAVAMAASDAEHGRPLTRTTAESASAPSAECGAPSPGSSATSRPRALQAAAALSEPPPPPLPRRQQLSSHAVSVARRLLNRHPDIRGEARCLSVRLASASPCGAGHAGCSEHSQLLQRGAAAHARAPCPGPCCACSVTAVTAAGAVDEPRIRTDAHAVAIDVPLSGLVAIVDWAVALVLRASKLQARHAQR